MSALSVPISRNKNPPQSGDITLRKKKNHDIAYLVIILAILFGTFLFAMMVVNSMLRTFG